MTEACNHPERAVKAKGMCGSCYNAYLINRDPETRERVLEKNRKNWANRHASRISDVHAAKQKNRALKHRYGIDLEAYNQMHTDQQNRCAICNEEGGTTRATRLYVDHNHATGAVRQLLCPGCNQAIGIIEQGVERVRALAAYLAKHDPATKAWNAMAKLDLYIRDQEAPPVAL